MSSRRLDTDARSVVGAVSVLLTVAIVNAACTSRDSTPETRSSAATNQVGKVEADGRTQCNSTEAAVSIQGCTAVLSTALAASSGALAAGAYYNRALAYRHDRHFTEAIADLTEALALDPAARIYATRALIYDESNDLARAIPDYDKALELDATLAAAWFRRGRAHTARGECTDARRDLDEAARLDSAFVAVAALPCPPPSQ